jgi:hypothetical protein
MRRFALSMLLVMATGCGRSETPASAPAPSADAQFQQLTDELLADVMKRNPSQATYLGIHDYDTELEDPSRAAVDAEVAALKGFRGRVAAVDPAGLTSSNQLDRDQALSAIDSRLLELEVIRPWAKNPDGYSSGITATAFVMIKRAFAPADVRLRALIARERLMPGVLQEARRNLDRPPAIYTDIAIEQLDGNKEFFATAVPAAFRDVQDRALLDQFKQTNDAVIAALTSYKTFLQHDLKPQSIGTFAIGTDILLAKYRADDMVDAPVDRLLAIAGADLKRNQKAFATAAARIAPGKAPRAVFASLASNHPAPAKLLETSQKTLDALRQFIEQKQLLTIPAAPPARVEETPPFMRAVTSASMDTPGPFETKATEAYYNMTLPDPSWPRPKAEAFMRQWYYPMIQNVSEHEVYPGHYTQFLYGPQFPS